jgi:DNA-binding IclR family transcriptional regulator
MKTQETVNSVVKGAEILRSLSEGTERISDLCTKLHLRKGTAHRLLKTLQMSGLVAQDPITRRYYLGPLILQMASRPMIAHQNLVVSAFEEMRRLRDLIQETVALHIRMGLERVCLEELQGLHDIKFTLGKGFVGPLYAGSTGKLLLSELEDAELELMIEYLRIVPFTRQTITEKKQLFKEIEKVRKQGYSISLGERVPESASISVAIKNYICPVALTILGPENRLSLDVMIRVLKEMKKSAERISRNLLQAK